METEFAVSLGSQRWTLPADGDTISIGRGSNADIRLPADDQISRIHARLNRTGTAWTLVDESRNGTALNGRRLAAPAHLTDNDRIHIGRSVLTFHESTPPAAGGPQHANSAGVPDLTTGTSATGAAGLGAGVGAAGLGAAVGAAGLGARAEADAAGAGSPPPPGPSSEAPLPPPRTTDGPPPPDDSPAPHRADVAGLADGGSPFAPVPSQAPAPPPGSPPPPAGPTDAPGNSPFRDSKSTAQPVPDQPLWSEHWADRPGEQGDELYDQIIGGDPEQSPFAPDAPDGGEWAGGARVGWVEPDDEPPSGAAWAAYPSANNPEPARSPWSGTKRPALTRPEGGQANWSESAGWPEAAFEQQERPAPPERQPQPVRRKPEPAEEPRPGHVRLVRVLLVAAAVLGLGLVLNLVASFFADGTGGTLRWLVPPAIALIAAMVVALIDAFSSEGRPAGGRLDVPVAVAIVAVLLGVGVGGFALTAGVEYVAGYITGKESGEDRLVEPVAKTGAGLTVTVENVTYTSHFTRVEVVVSNGGDQSLAFPPTGVTFTAADGDSLKADGFRSDWPDSVAAGNVERGTITFRGHLPEGLTAATLNLKSGDTTFAVPVALSN